MLHQMSKTSEAENFIWVRVFTYTT